MRLPEAVDLEREMVAREAGSLYRFIRLAWPHVETARYQDNWHIPVVCDYLQAVSRGEIKRLVINIPPGTMKSLTCSVFWPVWEWIHRPQTKWMYASYDVSLVGTLQGSKIIELLQSQWFIERWGTLLRETAPATSMFHTTAGGFRFATSPGGKGTGRHVHIQVVDDPNKPQDAEGTQAFTRKALDKTQQWWRGTASSRAVDAATFRRVILMQRIHSYDLAGVMLEEGGWTHLCLPMRYEKTTRCVCGDLNCSPEDPRTEEGELLWPGRFPEEVVKHQETVGMGRHVAAAQYQQRPTPAAGGVFETSWFRWWHQQKETPVPVHEKYPCRDTQCRVLPEVRRGQVYQSWDMTFKDTDGSDYVAGGVWLYHEGDAYLLDQVCERLSFVDTCRAVVRMSEKWPQSFVKYVEDKANGPAVENALKGKIRGIRMVNPEGGKLSRAHAITGMFEAGHVFCPHPDFAPWVWNYLDQLVKFPRGSNDDMVDQTTQLLIRVKPKNPLSAAMRQVRKDKKK